MLPTIGVMVGAYIFTRMLELLLNKERESVVAVFAVITMIIVFFGVIGLISSGAPSAP